MGDASARSIEDQSRRAVAETVATRTLLDVQECAELIARTYGCPTFIGSIATDLAEAAIAAGAPIKLSASVRT
jgi:hypothetical protein